MQEVTGSSPVSPTTPGVADPGSASGAAPTWSLFVGAWAAISLVLLWIARDFVFGAPMYEWADFAANALQIDRAKHFSELLGNYSRFNFHHPGPAFFYVYAASEVLFHDLLGVAAAPMNAHLLGSILLQSAFIAGAAVALASLPLIEDRRRFLAAAALTAMIVLTLAQHPELSIWPPYVLVGPMLAFLAATTAVATGDSRFLPLAAVSGVFLVHGHIAQVLIVAPLALAAYVALRLRGRALHHIAAAVIVAIGLLPIAIDTISSRPSNLSLILQAAHGSQRTLSQAVAYSLGFLEFPTWTSPPLSLSLRPVLGNVWPSLVLAGLVVLTALVVLRRRGLRRAELRRPALALYGVLLLAGGLAFVWALEQYGPPYAFNSFFVYALLVFGAMPLVIVVSRRVPAAVSAALLLLLVVLLPQPATLLRDPAAQALGSTMQGLDVGTDPILLQFDDADWGDAVAVGIQLERRGARFAADARWKFQFGIDHAYPGPAWPAATAFRTWRVERGSDGLIRLVTTISPTIPSHAARSVVVPVAGASAART